jgi:carbonic anhydrase/acetyltransferase-like protein (isoleucine patch superfamily)
MLYRFDEKQPIIGDYTYVDETAIVIGDVRIGNYCYIGPGAILLGDYGTIEMGDESVIEGRVIIHAPLQERCSIGQGVVIGYGAIIHAKRIGKFAAIGMKAVLGDRSEVGDETIVLDRAVVEREQEIKEAMIVGGNPAKLTGLLSQKERDFWALTRKHYRDQAQKYPTAGMVKIEKPLPPL